MVNRNRNASANSIGGSNDSEPFHMVAVHFNTFTPVGTAISMVVSMTGLSVAPYVLALVLIYLFAVRVQWFPAIGYTSLSADPVQNIRSLTLPSIALGFALFSFYTRLLRADII